MESRSGSGRDGIRIRDFTLPGRELRLAWVLGSASLVDLAGAGTTGDTICINTELFTTTTPTSLTAESSSIVTTSIVSADFMEPMGCMAPAVFTDEQEDSRTSSMELL